MNTFVISQQLTAFPIAKNRSVNGRQQRLMYEDNITNLIRQVIDTDGFVIQGNTDSFHCVQKTSSTCDVQIKNLSFNLYGYYFELKDSAENTTFFSVDFTQGALDVYASIKLTDNLEIDGQDNDVDKVYEGLKLWLGEEPSGDNLITLKLGTLAITDSGSGLDCVFTPEKLKFYLESFDKSIRFIDGKR